MSNLTRRALLKLAGGASAAAILGACKDTTTPADAPGLDAPPGCVASDASTEIADNHEHAPHTLVVTTEEVQAGIEKTYEIKGTANHNHMITVTADQFAMLMGGGTLMILSTEELDHDHLCTISCG
jgi:hypothetical protein